MGVAIILFCILVAFIEVVIGIRSVIRTIRMVLCGCDDRYHGDPSVGNPRLLILIPCLDEQRRIYSTLKAICSEFNSFNVKIVVVSCKRELPCDGLRTVDVVNRFVADTGFEVSICEFIGEGYMADQLTFALECLKQTWDYCLIYNADSKPAHGTAASFQRAMLRGFPVIQQYSTMTLNINGLSNLMKGFSLYQTNFELKAGFLGSVMPSLFSAPYVVGHGLLISSEIMDQIEFTNEHWCEDIYLSFSLFNQGLDIHPIFLLEKCECPSSFRAQVVQHAIWFKTAFDVVGIAKTELKRRSITGRGLRYLGIRFIKSLMWLASPLIIVLSFLIPAIMGKYGILVISLVAYLIMCFLEYGSTILLMFVLNGRSLPLRSLGKGFLWAPVARLLSCLGPLCSFGFKEKRRTPLD